MKWILIIFLLVGCATAPVKVTTTEDGAEVTGNAPGREISYTKGADGTVTITVRDERTPNPAKTLWDTIASWGKKAVETVDVSVKTPGD